MCPKPFSEEEHDTEDSIDSFGQVLRALSRTASQGGGIAVKSFDETSQTIVLSTGEAQSVIVNVVGFEGEHDIPVSQRPEQPRRPDPVDPDPNDARNKQGEHRPREYPDAPGPGRSW